ncbi:MAG: molybdopterin-dependent oxidoreductase [Coriobacteriia bacterium]
MTEDRFAYTVCMGAGCHEKCIIKTVVEDGKIVRTERAFKGDPTIDYILNDGICQKGIEYAKFPYMKERLLYPMKRVGARGEGKFERISWDQAMSEIGAKLRDIRTKWGNDSVLFNVQWSGYPAIANSLHMPLTLRFIHLSGANSSMMQPVDSGFVCADFCDFGLGLGYQTKDARALLTSKYIVLWGNAAIGNTRQASCSRYALQAQENGSKIVDVGLVFDPCAAKSDQFVPVKGGTDAALALSMCQVMIDEDLYNADYLRRKTVAPFLVREDTGKFLRESDVKEGGDPAKYMYWTAVPAKANAIADHTDDTGDKVPELLAAVTLNGIPCKTAFLKFKESVAQWTPERQEEMTGVPAATVRQMVHEFVAAAPAATVFMNLGLRYYNSREAYRAIQMFVALVGNIGSKEGGLSVSLLYGGYPVNLNNTPIIFGDDWDRITGEGVFAHEVYETMASSEPKYHALFNVVSNLVQIQPGRKMWEEEIFPKLDLIVNYDVRLSDTALFADYVLPDTTTFEREELIVSQGNYAVLQEPAIEPMGEAKPSADFFHLLAEQIGLGDDFNKTTEEWNMLRLNGAEDPAITGVTPPLTYERLKKEKYVHLELANEPFDPWAQYGFMTPSGRMEFYCEDMVEGDAAMAKWVPPLMDRPALKEYPLQLLIGRNRFHMQTQFAEFPDIQYLTGKEPWVWLNTVEGKARGLADGDMVEVFNHLGSATLQLRLTEAVPPGLAHLWLGYRKGDYKAGGATYLHHATGLPENRDATAEQWAKVSMARWGLPRGEKPSWNSAWSGKLPLSVNLETAFSSGYDVIFDAVCEIRKAEEA